MKTWWRGAQWDTAFYFDSLPPFLSFFNYRQSTWWGSENAKINGINPTPETFRLRSLVSAPAETGEALRTPARSSCWFSIAALTNNHTPGDLRQHKLVLIYSAGQKSAVRFTRSESGQQGGEFGGGPQQGGEFVGDPNREMSLGEDHRLQRGMHVSLDVSLWGREPSSVAGRLLSTETADEHCVLM